MDVEQIEQRLESSRSVDEVMSIFQQVVDHVAAVVKSNPRSDAVGMKSVHLSDDEA